MAAAQGGNLRRLRRAYGRRSRRCDRFALELSEGQPPLSHAKPQRREAEGGCRIPDPRQGRRVPAGQGYPNFRYVGPLVMSGLKPKAADLPYVTLLFT